jgi:hypothetical protein
MRPATERLLPRHGTREERLKGPLLSSDAAMGRVGDGSVTRARTVTNGRDRKQAAALARSCAGWVENFTVVMYLSSHPETGHRGARPACAAPAGLAHTAPDLTRSELEERFPALVARSGLPRPMVNAWVVGYEVDFLWPAPRLVAETDGAAAHLTPTAFERDRRRDAALQLAGFRVVRFTWRQVTNERRHKARNARPYDRAIRRVPRGIAD